MPSASPIRAVPLKRIFPGIETRTAAYHDLTDDYREMMGAHELDALCRLVAYWNPRRIFEFGTYLGGSALQMAVNTRAEIDTLDLPPQGGEKPVWDREIDVYPDEPGRKFHGTPYAERIHQVYADSQTYDFSPRAGAYDVVFVDACHHYEFVLSDSRNALRMVRPGGLVVWHDYADYAPGVVRALDEIGAGVRLEQVEGTSLVVHAAPAAAREDTPRISVVVPTRNRAGVLASALESMARQVHPADRHEIVVVDNGSTDRTRAVVEAAQAAHPDRAIRYVFEPEPGLLSGRHRGAREAEGSILTFADDDILVHPHWLSEVAAGFEDAEVHCVGGRCLPLYEARPPAWVEGFWARRGDERWLGYLSLVDLGEESKEIEPGLVFGLNFSIRKQTFFDLGGTHPDCIPRALQRYQGDGETGLSRRLAERGLKTVYRPGALVWHVIAAERLSVKAWEARQFYQGVCDSYTQVRANGGEATGPFKAAPVPWKPALPGSRRAVKRRLKRAYARGFAFHQREVAKDPALRAWVVRADYLDYRLPEGWRAYWSDGE